MADAIESYGGGRRPPEVHALLEDVRDALVARGVAPSVADLPRAPKFLLHVSCDALALADADATRALCNCLLAYTRAGNAGAAGDSGPAGRARSWALGVLSRMLERGVGCVEPFLQVEGMDCGGVGADDDAGEEEMPPSCPRDVVDCAVVDLLVVELTKGLQAIACSVECTGASGWPMLRSSIREVCKDLVGLMRLPDLCIDGTSVAPVVSMAVAVAGRLPVSLTSEEDAVDLLLPEEFVALLLGDLHRSQTSEGKKYSENAVPPDPPRVEVNSQDQGRSTDLAASNIGSGGARPEKGGIYNLLDLDSQATCLRLCPGLWEAQLARIARTTFSPGIESSCRSFDEEQSAVLVLARAACQDLRLHWKVVDALFAEMAHDSEPFSPRHWNDRKFIRAFHLALTTEIDWICSSVGVDANALQRASPMHRRFPVQVRPLITAILTFGRRICVSTAGLSAIHGALLELGTPRGAKSKAIMLPVDGQAILLALESHLQIVLASAVAAIVRNGQSAGTIWRMRNLDMLCDILCAADGPRDRGGFLAESPEEWLSRCADIRVPLTKVTQAPGRRGDPLSSPGLWKDLNLVGSLLAPVFVGVGVSNSVCYRADALLASEVLRMCESAKASMSSEVSDQFQLQDIYRAAMGTLLEGVSNAAAKPGNFVVPNLKQLLLHRQQLFSSATIPL